MQLKLHEFGAPTGFPLFFFHGWPGSGIQASLFDGAAKTHGFRLIAPDRPGIGESPLIPQRRLLDWPPLLRELAAQMHLDRFAVLGVSGGGPYALACAWACPDLVVHTAVACGAPPIAGLADLRQLHPAYRFLLWLFRRQPATVRRLFACSRPLMFWPKAAGFLQPLRILLPRPDARALESRKNFDVVFGCQRDAFTSVDGLFADAAIYAEPWGFAPEEIRVPVQFWHGRDDANFHFSLPAQLAARIPGATLQIVEDTGHFSLPIDHARMILATLAARVSLRP